LLAIGEIGLDYHYNLSPPEVSATSSAGRYGGAGALASRHRPSPQAESDLVKVLEEERLSEIGGILHSFTADLATAERALEMGFLISFSGILTFKNAAALREVARRLPLDRLLVESDCPYLTPVPHRGKRNEPAFVRDTLRCLAEVKGLPTEAVEQATDPTSAVSSLCPEIAREWLFRNNGDQWRRIARSTSCARWTSRKCATPSSTR
jgi:TatD DNase family protein